MGTRALAAALLALAALAAADALRGSEARDEGGAPASLAVTPAPIALAPERPHRFTTAGGYLHTEVRRNGREYLSAEAVDAAFPTPYQGPFDITDVAVARDGTLALAVYRFPASHPAHAAVQVWRGRTLVGAFTVPPRSVGGGLVFSADGNFVVLTSVDGRRVTAYTRGGQRAL